MANPNPPDGFTFFVGGIGHCSEDDLRTYFSQFGQITSIRIMMQNGTPRGFGFITMPDDSQKSRIFGTEHTIGGQKVDAKDAIKSQNTQVMAMPGMLNPFAFPQPSPFGPMGMQMGMPMGMPMAMQMGMPMMPPMMPPGFEQLQQFLKGKGKGKLVSPVKRTKVQKVNPHDATKLCLTNLTEGVTANDVKEYFSKFGTVVDVTVSSSKDGEREGTVRFDSEATVQSVLDLDVVHEIGQGKVGVRKCDSLKRLGDPLDMSLDDLSAQDIGVSPPTKRRKKNKLLTVARPDCDALNKELDDLVDDDQNGDDDGSASGSGDERKDAEAPIKRKRRTRGGRSKAKKPRIAMPDVLPGIAMPLMQCRPPMQGIPQAMGMPIPGLPNAMLGFRPPMPGPMNMMPGDSLDLGYGKLPSASSNAPKEQRPQLNATNQVFGMSTCPDSFDIGYGKPRESHKPLNVMGNNPNEIEVTGSSVWRGTVGVKPIHIPLQTAPMPRPTMHMPNGMQPMAGMQGMQMNMHPMSGIPPMGMSMPGPLSSVQPMAMQPMSGLSMGMHPMSGIPMGMHPHPMSLVHPTRISLAQTITTDARRPNAVDLGYGRPEEQRYE